MDRPTTMPTTFALPPVITDLVVARNRLRDHYRSAALEFTLDGNLIGDIGEAVAAELFGLKLSPRNGTGIDGQASDGAPRDPDQKDLNIICRMALREKRKRCFLITLAKRGRPFRKLLPQH